MAPRVSRKPSAKKTKTPTLKKNPVFTLWDDHGENDVLASPLEEPIIKSMAGNQGTLSFCIKRKPIIGSPKKCIDAVEAICDENVETAINSPEKKNCLRTPKRKLFNDDTDCSPSKQTCSPAKNGTNKTPSSFLKKLEIIDDSIEKCGSLKPKSLFGTLDTSYSVARQALHSSQPSSLPGREKQLVALREFLLARLENKQGARGSLYISGAPGTGKTASVNLTLEHNKIKSSFKTVYINCTSMNTSKAIFSRVAQELQVKVQGRTEKATVTSIQKHIIHSKKKLLLLLDEVDQLESRNQSVLYTIFEWPCLTGSQLTLIGIANSLDLTDRLLPRLQAHVSCRPQLMHYAPYTKQQITDIIHSRLQQAGASHVFKNVAVEMLAAKVAAVSGDARRALDIGRRGVELAETKNYQAVPALRLTADSGSNTGSPRRSPRKSPQKACHSETATVGILEVRNVLDGVYGTSQSLISSDAPGNDGLPMQQKILICSLLLMLRKGKNKDVTVGKLHEVYSRVCEKRNLNSAPQSEFYSMCCLIETRGILRVAVSKKETRLSKLSLQWDDEDISAALCGKNLLADILSDVSCLSGKFN